MSKATNIVCVIGAVVLLGFAVIAALMMVSPCSNSAWKGAPRLQYVTAGLFAPPQKNGTRMAPRLVESAHPQPRRKLAVLVQTSTAPPPPPTIFVSIPSYRDPEVKHTLVSLFTQAQHPQSVFVGLCQQNAAPDHKAYIARADDDALDAATKMVQPDIAAIMRSNVRNLVIPFTEAKGPLYARSRIERELYHDEDYLLMIDSHMQFSSGWDVGFVEEYGRCPNEGFGAVLTHYPGTYERTNRDGADFEQPPQKLFFAAYEGGSDMPMWNTIAFDGNEHGGVPPLSRGWAAGCSFTARDVLKRVPFHDHTEYPWLFFGEEVGMAARFITNGVNLYCPTRNYVLTTYDREDRPLFWEDLRDTHGDEEASRQKMRTMLGIRVEKEPRGVYGRGKLGDRRTLEQFEAYMGFKLASVSKTSPDSSGRSLAIISSRQL